GPLCLTLVPMTRRPPIATRFPYTTLFRSQALLDLLVIPRGALAAAFDQRRQGLHTAVAGQGAIGQRLGLVAEEFADCAHPVHLRDRKSTRLNSSHVKISYAVFCLQKKSNQ